MVTFLSGRLPDKIDVDLKYLGDGVVYLLHVASEFDFFEVIHAMTV